MKLNYCLSFNFGFKNEFNNDENNGLLLMDKQKEKFVEDIMNDLNNDDSYDSQLQVMEICQSSVNYIENVHGKLTY